LRGSFGLGVKEPTFFQSFGFSADPCFPGNQELRPERSRAGNFGVEQLLAGDRVRVSAEGFFNRFRDIVSFTFCFAGGPCPVTPPPACGFGFGTFFNTDLARAHGAIVSVEARATRWLRVSGNYTFTDSRVLDAPNAFDPALVPGQRLFRRPVHMGNIFLAATFSRWSASFSGAFVGPRTDSDFLGLGITRNAGYARFDFTTRVAIRRGVEAFGRVENLFDREYQEVLGYRALRRTFRGGMKFVLGGE
jgi:vitamin B12 transporter